MKKTIKYLQLIFVTIIVLILSQNLAFAQDEIIGEIINVNYQYKIAFTDLSSYYLKIGDILGVYKSNKLITFLEVSETTSAISKLIPINPNNQSYRTSRDFTIIKVGYKVSKISKKDNLKMFSPEERGEDINKTQEPEKPSENVAKTIFSSSDKDDMAEQFRKLSENYVALSNGLATLINEKNNLITENLRYAKDLEIANQRIKELRNQNTSLEDKVNKLQLSIQGDDKTAYIKEIEKLNQIINVLKEKLKQIANKIEGDISYYEKP